MDKRNSLGFLGIGAGMGILPAIAPHWFPPQFGGMDARAMWLVGMGVVQIAIGGAVAFQGYAWPFLRRHREARRAAAACPRAIRFGATGRWTPG